MSFLRNSVVVLLLTTLFCSCEDHLPLESQRLRLKKTVESFGGEATLTTEFNYDANGRQISQQATPYPANPDYPDFFHFYYNDQSRVSYATGKLGPSFLLPVEEPQPNGYRLDYRYDGTGRLERINYAFTFKNVATLRPYRVHYFEYNAMNQVAKIIQKEINVIPGQGTDYEKKFTYANGNITQVDQVIYAVGTKNVTFRNRFLYTYDNKPNPYYGLSGLNVPLVLMFSRNHYTSYSSQSIGEDGSVGVSTNNSHEVTYNAQGNIASWRGYVGNFGSTKIDFEYESY
ncbi:hypothetical protein [Larkinella terrae]|uniref:DUF4595 domain-containing protein n=1 Tax=Larkinella terrae TaxID=2025311 RepID=A0A7K0ETR8_9BACT|nr:hypothetical protein [Larkinella terrae]MRS64828.1 hypothetical protein [Larkinella terrae]